MQDWLKPCNARRIDKPVTNVITQCPGIGLAAVPLTLSPQPLQLLNTINPQPHVSLSFSWRVPICGLRHRAQGQGFQDFGLLRF